MAQNEAPVAVRRPSDARRVRLLNVVGVAGSAASVAYIAVPGSVAWAAVPLQGWARWAGGVLGLMATGLFFWTHRSLGQHWSGTLLVREGHELVTEGPYRWIRHPMYDAVVVSSLGTALLSANWFIGLTGIAAALVLASRIGEEEEMMAQSFGDRYDAYRGRTGRFLPALSRAPGSAVPAD